MSATALLVIDVQECGRQPYDEAGIAQMSGYDERVGRIAGDLFETSDLQNAVRTFLEQGPGRAGFEGR